MASIVWKPEVADRCLDYRFLLEGETDQPLPIRICLLQFQAMCLVLRSPATVMGVCELGRKTLPILFSVEAECGIS